MKANKNTKKKLFHYPPLNRPRLPTREEMEQFIDYLGAADIFAETPSKLLAACYLVVYDLNDFSEKIMMVFENDINGFPKNTIIAHGYTTAEDKDIWRVIGMGKNTQVKQA